MFTTIAIIIIIGFAAFYLCMRYVHAFGPVNTEGGASPAKTSEEALDRYKFVQAEIRYLYTLMSSRMAWIATVQSFLIAAYAATTAMADTNSNHQKQMLQLAIVVLAIIVLFPAIWIIWINYKTLRSWLKLRFDILSDDAIYLNGYAPKDERDLGDKILRRRLLALNTRPILVASFILFWLLLLVWSVTH